MNSVNSYSNEQMVMSLYAKRQMECRMEYIGRFIEEHEYELENAGGYPRRRTSLKKALIIAAILILTFALLLIAASGLGIKILDASIFGSADHDVVTAQSNCQELQSKGYLSTGYLPEGYEFLANEELTSESILSTYENSDGQILTLQQSKKEDIKVSFDTETSTKTRERADDVEAYCYTWSKEGLVAALCQKDGVFIMISGNVSKDEVLKIIEKLK